MYPQRFLAKHINIKIATRINLQFATAQFSHTHLIMNKNRQDDWMLLGFVFPKATAEAKAKTAKVKAQSGAKVEEDLEVS